MIIIFEVVLKLLFKIAIIEKMTIGNKFSTLNFCFPFKIIIILLVNSINGAKNYIKLL